MPKYYIFHKPFQVLTQFSAEGDKRTLSDFFRQIPKNIYPVGRLDYDSEGLLLLTDDKPLTHQLLDPSFAHPRTYWVQVEGEITNEAISQLESGVTITVDGKHYRTKKAKAQIFKEQPDVAERNPPVRFRKSIPTSWISLTLTEGKNRQVRKMTAATGFPTLRLIRYSIGNVTLDGLAPGEHKMMQRFEP
ncbi:MAG: pseudouridine synthase [Flavipsychrobacter sp.]|nr:pseudouridine synthase [Flavipsychrobacter sp.]